MEKITLEKVDMVRERMNVTYEKAKEALEASDGNVLDAIIYIEKEKLNEETQDSTESYCEDFEEEFKKCISIEELKKYIKELIEKGNVTRIKIKKDDKVIVDMPVNAGVAGAVIGIIIPQILAVALITAIIAQITVEITKEDGTVEVINKYVSKMAEDVKEKASDIADMVKNKMNEVRNDAMKKTHKEDSAFEDGDTVYTYTVNFEEDKPKEEDKSQEE